MIAVRFSRVAPIWRPEWHRLRRSQGARPGLGLCSLDGRRALPVAGFEETLAAGRTDRERMGH